MIAGEIDQSLSRINNLPLRSVGRAANMLMLGIGEFRDSFSRVGRICIVSEWALHVQCAWRICQRGRIILAYRDFYYSASGDPLDDWGTPGNSFFDITSVPLNEQFLASPPYVMSISVDDVGGFSIRLTQDYRLDVFPEDSRTDCEHWRLFQSGVEQNHFVFRET
jgi:hypothetical protein